MKLIRFISVLFFGLVFVLPVATEAKSRHGEFSEGDRDPPPFACKQVSSPIHSGIKKKNFLGYEPKELKIEGDQKNLVVLVSFSNQEIDRDVSEEVKKAEEVMFNGENSVNEYYQEVSGGRLRLIGEVLVGLRILPKTFEEYGGSLSNLAYSEILEDTIATVDNDIYFPDYDRIIIIIFMKEKSWLGTAGTIGKWSFVKSDDGDLFISACWIMEGDKDTQFVWRHEIGHTLGLGHAGSFLLENNEDICNRLCYGQEIKKDTYGGSFEECTTYEYGDSKDLMGDRNCHISTYYKNGLGWLDEDEVFEIKENGIATVAIVPRSASSSEGFKMIVIGGKSTDGNKNQRTYFLEYFKKLGNFDDIEEKSQVFLRYHDQWPDNLEEGGDGYVNLGDTFLVLEKVTSQEEQYNSVTSFCDSTNGIQIELLGEYGDGENSYAEVQITLFNAEEPTPTPTPVQEKEMILEVSINEVKAADNDIIIVSKGDWVRIAASVFDWYDENIMEDLQADKITCQIKNKKGKIKYYKEQENSSGSSFAFKAKRRGQFDVEVVAYKTGYETASFQGSFKAK